MESSNSACAGRSLSIGNSSDIRSMSHCLWIASPSNRFHQFPREKHSSRFRLLGDHIHDSDDDDHNKETATTITTPATATRPESRRGSSWRDGFKRLVKECRRSSSSFRGKKMSICCSCYSSRPINTFGYDAASHLKNFDDGCPNDDHYAVLPLATHAPTQTSNLKAAC